MSSLEEFDHLRVTLKEILEATNDFSDENLIGRGKSATVYKGQLLRSEKWIDVAVRRLNSNVGEVDVEFFAEISILSCLEHENVNSLIGFCDDNGEKMIVKKHELNASLDRHLSSTTLTWMQRLHICFGAANALRYLHKEEGRNYGVIHRNIKSSKILVDENWEAKISGFELSLVNPERRRNRLLLIPTPETSGYLDPISRETGSVTYKSDSYSFGIVLFEVLCGRLCMIEAGDDAQRQLLAPLVKRHYDEGKLDEIIPVYLRNQINQKSLSVFSETTYYCLKEQRTQRPDMEHIARKLYKAMELQQKHDNPEPPLPAVRTWSTHVKVNRVDILKISKKHILSATENFSEKNIIGKGGFGDVYRGEVLHAHKRNTVAIKRHVASHGQGEREFLTELEILFEYKHENVIGLVGYHNDLEETIIVYEHAVRGSVDNYLDDVNLTWAKRIKICIDVASGLSFLHGGVGGEEMVIHRDIKSRNILLDGDWKAKISDFGLSMITPINQHMNHVMCDPVGTGGYVDQLYVETGYLTKECDVYSLGVVLLEIICGRLALLQQNGRFQLLQTFFRRSFEDGKFDDMVFDGLKEKIVPKSLILFSTIVYQCLHYDRKQRPTTDQVIVKLKEALEIQEDYDTWEPKLPRDYKEIIKMSNLSNIDIPDGKRDLYNMFCKGLLLQNDKVWFSLSIDGSRNEMISVAMFSFKNLKSFKWSSIQSSREKKKVEAEEQSVCLMMVSWYNLKGVAGQKWHPHCHWCVTVW